MGLKINVNIIEVEESFFKEDIIFNNSIDSLKTGSSWDVDSTTPKKQHLTSDNTNSFSFLLSNLVGDISDLTFVHISCETRVLNPDDTSLPVKFDVTFDGGTVTVSQFQMLNVDGLAGDIEIDNVQLVKGPNNAVTEADLTIIVGEKTT